MFIKSSKNASRWSSAFLCVKQKALQCWRVKDPEGLGGGLHIHRLARKTLDEVITPLGKVNCSRCAFSLSRKKRSQKKKEKTKQGSAQRNPGQGCRPDCLQERKLFLKLSHRRRVLPDKVKRKNMSKKKSSVYPRTNIIKFSFYQSDQQFILFVGRDLLRRIWRTRRRHTGALLF